MRAKVFARVACSVAAFALVSLLLSYGRLLRTVETAATEAGIIERAV